MDAEKLLYYVAGIGIDTDHGEYYDLPLDDYVSQAESLLWEARVYDPRLTKAWAWCFEHCCPGGWKDEDGAREAYFLCREARPPDLRCLRRYNQFLRRERKRGLRVAFTKPACRG